MVKVLREFLENPMRDHYGLGLMRSTGLKSGTLYPVLEQLLERGWLENFLEDIDEHAEGRPKRRLYRLTGVGETEARRAVIDFYRDLGPTPSWLPDPEPV